MFAKNCPKNDPTSYSEITHFGPQNGSRTMHSDLCTQVSRKLLAPKCSQDASKISAPTGVETGMAKSTYSGPPLQKSTKIGPKIHQNYSQNLQNWSQIRFLGGFWADHEKCYLFTPMSPPFSALREASWSELATQFGPSWANLAPNSAELAPRCLPEAPSWPRLAPKSPKFAPEWTQDGLPEDFFTVFKGCPNLYRFFNRFGVDFS